MMDSKAFADELDRVGEELWQAIEADLAELEPASLNQAQIIEKLKMGLYAEGMVTEGPARRVAEVSDWEMKRELVHQSFEESHHAQLLRERLTDLGVAPEATDIREWHDLFEAINDAPSLGEYFAAMRWGAEAWFLRTAGPFAKACELVDAKTASMYREQILPDEAHHMSLAREGVERYCVTPESQEAAMEMVRQTAEMLKRAYTAQAERIATLA